MDFCVQTEPSQLFTQHASLACDAFDKKQAGHALKPTHTSDPVNRQTDKPLHLEHGHFVAVKGASVVVGKETLKPQNFHAVARADGLSSLQLLGCSRPCRGCALDFGLRTATIWLEVLLASASSHVTGLPRQVMLHQLTTYRLYRGRQQPKSARANRDAAAFSNCCCAVVREPSSKRRPDCGGLRCQDPDL